MSAKKPADSPLLLEVFREGMINDLISKDEIVAWANSIIRNENEPSHFFIELSLSPDTNGIAEVLDQHISRPASAISFRVIIGIIHQKLSDSAIEADRAIVLLDQINSRNILTPFESDEIYSCDDYELLYPRDLVAVKEDVLKFLSLYKDLRLGNYDQWSEINSRIEEILKEEQIKADAYAKAWRKASKKRAIKRNLKRYSLLSIPVLILLFIIILNIKLMQDEPTVSKMFDDHNYIFFLDFFIFYFSVRTAYTAWKQRRRRR